MPRGTLIHPFTHLPGIEAERIPCHCLRRPDQRQIDEPLAAEGIHDTAHESPNVAFVEPTPLARMAAHLRPRGDPLVSSSGPESFSPSERGRRADQDAA